MSHPGAKIGKLRRWHFLKAVFGLGITAFGGPQMHIPYFIKKLVIEKNFCDKKTLLDINSFCSILPGPSTTQTITALGFKLGGARLAFQALLAWVLPGAIILSILTVSPKFLAAHHLRFMQPMVAAFLCYAVYSMFLLIPKGVLNYVIFIAAGFLSFVIHSPLIFPAGIIIGGILSANFGNRKFVPNPNPFGKIKLINLTLYLTIFITVGMAGLVLLQYEKYLGIARPLVLFENCYRMGSLAYGGGNTLAAMAMDQYHYQTHRLSFDELNIGLGLIQGLPGPIFNLSAYLNGISMRNLDFGLGGQLLGCVMGIIGIYLPGTLLIFFVYPIWNRLQTYPIVQRSLDGIFATSVGFILGAAATLNQYFFSTHTHFSADWQYYLIFTVALFSLLTKKIPSPFIVIGTILAGVFLPL